MAADEMPRTDSAVERHQPVEKPLNQGGSGKARTRTPSAGDTRSGRNPINQG
jgi:hypothetical protein